MKQFVAFATEYGIDTGWRLFPEDYPESTDSIPFDLIWGHCRDVTALRSLIAEMRINAYEFELAPETLALMDAT